MGDCGSGVKEGTFGQMNSCLFIYPFLYLKILHLGGSFMPLVAIGSVLKAGVVNRRKFLHSFIEES